MAGLHLDLVCVDTVEAFVRAVLRCKPHAHTLLPRGPTLRSSRQSRPRRNLGQIWVSYSLVIGRVIHTWTRPMTIDYEGELALESREGKYT